MSFSSCARKVRNPALPIWARLGALRSCIRLLSVLTDEAYPSALARFDARFGFNRHRDEPIGPPTDEQLLDTLAAVEAERTRILTRLSASARSRAEAKQRGRRRTPTAGREGSKADRDE